MKVSQPAFFRSLESPHKTIVMVLFLGVSTFLASLAVWGYWAAVSVAVLIVAILWLTKPLWANQKQSLGVPALAVVSSVALTVLDGRPKSKPVVSMVLGWLHLPPKAAATVLSSDRLLSCVVMLFVLLAIYILSRISSDRSAMSEHPVSIDEDFPEQSYKKQRARFTQILSGRLSRLDEETKWDEYYFTPLEAEVTINSSGLTRKRVVNLMTALKAENTSKVVLLLGDPGAGKSIALRTLARDLLNEVDRTGRIPVYVNLKEWSSLVAWDENLLPTSGDLRAFVLSTLKGQNSFADQFLSQYYDRMFDRGRFFFLLDSFDEIPSVLDAAEASTLIERLSLIIADFFASQDDGRGVISSRFYRRPRIARSGIAVLEIRPFSDLRIYQALMQSNRLTRVTVERLFTSRSELVPVARNPFAAALIRMYAEANGGTLPDNQLEMYDSYIASRLSSAAQKLEELNLTPDQVQLGATNIAWAMFGAQDIGLEASLPELQGLLPDTPIPAITTILSYSGLARLSTGPRPRFSFVHRRLNEYFVARRILLHPSSVSLKTIPSDSRYRDALALYCEVGSQEDVRDIADFCWTEIHRVDLLEGDASTADRLSAVHCLRFLRDAFGSRVEVLTFRKELALYIQSKLKPLPDLLDAKIALEASGLLIDEDASRVFIGALDLSNAWLSDSSLRACRNLGSVDTRLRNKLEDYLLSIPAVDVLRRTDEIRFSLSLSDGFKGLKRLWITRSIDVRILCVVLLIALVVSPFAGLIGIFGVFYMPFIAAQNKSLRNETFWRFTAFPLLLFPFFQPQLAPVGRSLSAVMEAMIIKVLPFMKHSPSQSQHSLTPLWRLAQSHHSSTVACVLLLTVLLSPWCQLASTRRRRWHHLVAFCLGSACPICVAILLYHSYPRAFRIVAGLFIAVSLLIGIVIVSDGVAKRILWAFNCWRDRRIFDVATQSAYLTKEIIYVDFLKFRTPWYRKAYVSWLREVPITPDGDWPSGRPNVINDVASTSLAQLDERWMGLDS